MKSTSKNNPWNGLRTYQEGEIIYGRSEEIQILTLLIQQNTQTVIYGKSGIGKSSILNAGVFPIIRSKNILPIYIRLEYNSNISYIEQIKNRIKEEIEKTKVPIHIKKLLEKTDSESLWEFFHRVQYFNEKGEKIIPLIVLDQFEEIFTLEKNSLKVNRFFREIADVLNNVMPENLLKSNIHNDTSLSLYSENDTLDLGLGSLNINTYSYNQDMDFRFVFILREDFLSYLERNTTDIPSLKNSRYCLQPINEEQAAEIILSPRPDLVNLEVAKLIIEKVTGERNFKIDGVPQIQVDAAILSLYLNQIYDRMINEGESQISKSLIETYSENIIQDFYNSAISQLSELSIDWLENTLINEAGRRDNRDRVTVIKKTGLSEEKLNTLINDTKLLHQFSYGGQLRIEFIHDILCPVVVKNREYRKQRKILEEESRQLIEQQKLHALQLKRRNRWMAIVLGTFLIVGIIISIYYFSMPKLEKYSLLLAEDDSINLTDYWKAKVSVLSGNDTLHMVDIDKSNPMFVFEVPEGDAKGLHYEVDFLIGDFGVGEAIVDAMNNTNEIIIPISHITNRKLIKGVVASHIGSKAPIYNALVILDDQLAKTNYKGEFSLYVDSKMQDSTIRIIKKRYKPYEGQIQKGVYRLFLNGEDDFPSLAASMENSIVNASEVQSMEGYYYSIENGKVLKGKAHMIINISGDSIRGYTYYDSLYDRSPIKINSYFIINGRLNPVNKTFKMHFLDAVYNEQEYTGHISDEEQWYGETFDKNKKIGYFIFN